MKPEDCSAESRRIAESFFGEEDRGAFEVSGQVNASWHGELMMRMLVEVWGRLTFEAIIKVKDRCGN